jgi:hypothetical protein
VVGLTWADVYSVIDHVSTILSVPLAVGGFWIALHQIGKTRRAAEAARDMATAAREDASRASVLVLIPQLQRVEEQIDRAVDAKSVELVIAWANTWRWQASQLNEHLRTLPSMARHELPRLLQESVIAAANVKKSLTGNTPSDLQRSTKRMRDAVTAVTSELGGLVVHYSALPERTSE